MTLSVPVVWVLGMHKARCVIEGKREGGKGSDLDRCMRVGSIVDISD